jgi:hypothetical protein
MSEINLAPRIYANSFAVGHTLTEFGISFTFGSETLVQITLSPIVAKSLSEELLKLSDQYEKKAGVKIPRLEDISTEMRKHFPESDESK